jgi:hypothetical protein
LADLNLRKDDLQAQISRLQREISATRKRQLAANPRSPEGRREAQLLAGLQTEQANLSLQLDNVKDKIATGGPAGSSSSAGTSVIQQATEAIGLSTVLRLLVWAPSGAVICTILAAMVLLAVARRDRRIRYRDDIADAVGSPVLAAVQSRPQRSVAAWTTLLETYEPTPMESWAFRQVLRGIAPVDREAPQASGPGKLGHPQWLTLISVSGDQRGLAIGPQLAAFASSVGIRTQLLTAVSHEWNAAPLWAACAVEHDAPLRPGLYLGEVRPEEEIDMTVTLVVVDRTQPNLGEVPNGATILSVAAGTATEQELARVAVAVDDAGRRIDGIVVADPEQTDRTFGRHTMEERFRRPTLPVRLTGTPPPSSHAAEIQRRSRV